MKRRPSSSHPPGGVKQAKTSLCSVSLWCSGSNSNSELYKGPAEWSKVWDVILPHMGPRGSFRMKRDGGKFVALNDSTNCITDYWEGEESVSNRFRQATPELVAGNYHMRMLQDDKCGLSLVFAKGDPGSGDMEERINDTAELKHKAGFTYNTSPFLTWRIKEDRKRKEPSCRIWGELWSRSLLKPLQCKSCKAITTVLGAHLLQWPIYIGDTCFTCHQRWFQERHHGRNDGVINCARCHLPIFDSETNSQIRYQDKDKRLWCASCSLGFGDNFTAG